MPDARQELMEIFRKARRYMREGMKERFSHEQEGFRDFANEAVDTLIRHLPEADNYYASVAGEVIPRIFATDVVTGYRFFHDHDTIKKLWAIYNRATEIVAARIPIKRAFRHKPPYKTAFISAMFSDYIAPAKALANFALHVPREQFSPMLIVTNQVETMERRNGYSVVGFNQMNIGRALLDQGIDIVGLPAQSDLETLAMLLIDICAQYEVDIVVTNASMFSFPEACLARSGVVGSLFDMHRGFPLYVNGIDAILHWVAATRESQLGPWLEQGGKVIDYHDGISVPPLPSPMPEHDNKVVRFITVSNYLQQRMSPEFCQVANRLLHDFPDSVYRLVGGCDQNDIASRFAPELRSRLEFTGPVAEGDSMRQQFFESDIYLNEFPVSGVRVCLEAMCACLPVITMKCGGLHVNATAVEHVGDFAIHEYDPERYHRLAASLAADPLKRRECGMSLRRRMEDSYDYKATLADLSAKILAMHQAKVNAMILTP